MLNITIEKNGDEAKYTIKHDIESYKDPFVNNKQKVCDVMVNTADKLGGLDKESNFKSLEFKTMTENFATIIYNNSKQLQVYFDSDSGVLCLRGIDHRVTADVLAMAFFLDYVVKDYE